MKRMAMTEAFLRFFAWTCIFSAMFLLVANQLGCSAVEAINTNASEIQTLAQSSEQRFEAIAEISDVPEVDKQTEQGIIEQRSIQDSVANIRNALPRIEDKESSFMVLLQRLALAGILIASIFLIWQTGIGTLLRKLLYSISMFIPSKSMREAEMDMKIADDGNGMTIRESIASKRASSVAYNSAYLKLRKRK
tara:strand:+ start:4196 stop:4774 length:579 start_codon:yes stop_codon:yes gene_type:complete